MVALQGGVWELRVVFKVFVGLRVWYLEVRGFCIYGVGRGARNEKH